MATVLVTIANGAGWYEGSSNQLYREKSLVITTNYILIVVVMYVCTKDVHVTK